MLAVTEMGGIVAPPVPAFYTRPRTIGDLVDQTIGRVLDLFGLDAGTFPRWGETISLLADRERDTASALIDATTTK
jgi:4-hydroxy-3-polyprenylbenzoate decarboxylase